MSIEDDVKQATESIRTTLEEQLYGSSGTVIHVNDDITAGSTSGHITLDPNGTTVAPNMGIVDPSTSTGVPWTVDSSDVVFADSPGTWGSITVQAGPWTISGKPNGDLEVVFETKDERKEYHFNHEKITALLEKFADVKVEGKKEDV
jgi:hypothetical protein